MKAFFKKYWWIIVILLALPIVINSFYLLKTNCTILHTPSPWATFWATYLAAIASFVMVFFTWKTLNEMKRQWLEVNRARLTFAIVSHDGNLFLKISNCGETTAFNIKIYFNKEFIDCHFSHKIREDLCKLSKPFCIEAGTSKYYYISPTDNNARYIIGGESFLGSQITQWLDEHKLDNIIITGRYCDVYSIIERFSIAEYINGGAVVKDELTLAVERIKSGTIVQNNQYYPIQKSLDIIANNIIKITQNMASQGENNRHKDGKEQTK